MEFSIDRLLDKKPSQQPNKEVPLEPSPRVEATEHGNNIPSLMGLRCPEIGASPAWLGYTYANSYLAWHAAATGAAVANSTVKGGLYALQAPRLCGRRQRRPGCDRKPRQAYSAKQLEHLEAEFKADKYLSVTKRMELSKILGLTEVQIKTWFQNRRTKWKKQMTANLKLVHRPCLSFPSSTSASFAYNPASSLNSLLLDWASPSASSILSEVACWHHGGNLSAATGREINEESRNHRHPVGESSEGDNVSRQSCSDI